MDTSHNSSPSRSSDVTPSLPSRHSSGTARDFLVTRALRIGLRIDDQLASQLEELCISSRAADTITHDAQEVYDALGEICDILQLVGDALRKSDTPSQDTEDTSDGASFEVRGRSERLSQMLAPFLPPDASDASKTLKPGRLLSKMHKGALANLLQRICEDLREARRKWEVEKSKPNPSLVHFANIARHILRPRSYAIEKLDRPPLEAIRDLYLSLKEREGSHLGKASNLAQEVRGKLQQFVLASGGKQACFVGSLNPRILRKHTLPSEMLRKRNEAWATLHQPIRSVCTESDGRDKERGDREKIARFCSAVDQILAYHPLRQALERQLERSTDLSSSETPSIEELSVDNFGVLLRRTHRKGKERFRKELEHAVKKLSLDSTPEDQAETIVKTKLNEIVDHLRTAAATDPALHYFLSLFSDESSQNAVVGSEEGEQQFSSKLREAVVQEVARVIIPRLRKQGTGSGSHVHRDDNIAQRVGRNRYRKIKGHGIIKAKESAAQFRGDLLRTIHTAETQSSFLTHRASLLLAPKGNSDTVQHAYLLLTPLLESRANSPAREHNTHSPASERPSLETLLRQAQPRDRQNKQEILVVDIHALTLRGLKKLVERNREALRKKFIRHSSKRPSGNSPDISFATREQAKEAFKIALEDMRSHTEQVLSGILDSTVAHKVLTTWERLETTEGVPFPDSLHIALAREAYQMRIKRYTINWENLIAAIKRHNAALSTSITDDTYAQYQAREHAIVFGELLFLADRLGWNRTTQSIARWRDILSRILRRTTTPVRLDAEVKVAVTPSTPTPFRSQLRFRASRWNATFTITEFPDGLDLRRNFPFDEDDKERIEKFAQQAAETIKNAVATDQGGSPWRYGIDRGQGELASLVVAHFASDNKNPEIARTEVWVFDHMQCVHKGYTRHDGVPASILNPADFLRRLGAGEEGWRRAVADSIVHSIPDFALALDLSAAKIVGGRLTLNGGVGDLFALRWHTTRRPQKETTCLQIVRDVIRRVCDGKETASLKDLQAARAEAATFFRHSLATVPKVTKGGDVVLQVKGKKEQLQFPAPVLAPYGMLEDYKNENEQVLRELIVNWIVQYTHRIFDLWINYANQHSGTLPLEAILTDDSPFIAERINNIQRSIAANIVGVIRHLYFRENLKGFVSMEFLPISARTDHSITFFNTTRELEWALLGLFQKPYNLASSAELERLPLVPPHLRRRVVERLMAHARDRGQRCVHLGSVILAHAENSSVCCPLCLQKRKGKASACSACGFDPLTTTFLQPMWSRVAQEVRGTPADPKAHKKNVSADLIAALVLANPEFCAVPLELDSEAGEGVSSSLQDEGRGEQAAQ